MLIILFLACCDCDVHPLLVLLMQFLIILIVMFMTSSFDAINGLLVMLVVFFIIGHDHDIHKFFPLVLLMHFLC